MDTRTRTDATTLNWMDPLGGWEAAARWNQMTLEWMTKGWQQWLQLATAWPTLGAMKDAEVTLAGAELEPAGMAPAGTQEARNARAVGASQRPNEVTRRERAVAKSGAKRGSAKRSSRPQAASRPSARSRG